MTDIGDTIQAKSDQLNADDLMAGPIVITITRVQVGRKGDDQPVTIYYDGDNGRPYKPSKGMRRILVAMWGGRSADYVGRSLELYRDPTVTFGKEAVGGIRIGRASHIDGKMRVALQVKKGQKAGHEVLPLPAQGGQQQRQAPPPPTLEGARAAIKNAADLATLEKAWGSPRMADFKEQLQDDYDAKRDSFGPPPADTNPPAQNGAGDNGDWQV